MRDFLVRLAMTGLFRAHWSDRILDEMVASILGRRSDLRADALERTRELMNGAVRDARTTGYETLIDSLELPEPDNRHVLACAIRSGSQIIVTDNVADFPASALQRYNIEAQTPDTFVLHLVELSPCTVAAAQAQATSLVDPPMTVTDVLDRLARSGLSRSAAAPRDR